MSPTLRSVLHSAKFSLLRASRRGAAVCQVLSRDEDEYLGFVDTCYRAGVVPMTTTPLDVVSPFFVVKKSKRLRMVFDCRGPNELFRKCPPQPRAALRLGGGSS